MQRFYISMVMHNKNIRHGNLKIGWENSEKYFVPIQNGFPQYKAAYKPEMDKDVLEQKRR
jgi:hypothetical protein